MPGPRIEPALDLLQALLITKDPRIRARFNQHLADGPLAISDCTRNGLRALAKGNPRLLEQCNVFIEGCHRVKEPVGVSAALESRRMEALRKGDVFDAAIEQHALAARATGNLIVALAPDALRQLGVDAIALPAEQSAPRAHPPEGRPAPSAPHLTVMDGG